MFNSSRYGLLVFVVAFVFACGSDDESPPDSAGDPSASPTGGAAAAAAGVGGNAGGGGGIVPVPPMPEPDPICGDAELHEELGEECDDGNTNDTDGCTAECKFTCHTDADCEQDPCSGTGSTCSPETHTCIAGTGSKPDGEPCGEDSSCYGGICVPNGCGNGFQEPDEECDDANTDDFDGCTAECKYSCLSTDDAYPSCANECDLTATCDDETHACVPGTPLPDGAICDNGAGYCVNGHCMPSDCGDGVQEPNEECDKGADNGAQDAGCTEKCTIAVCGDGTIDGLEQCDDGNLESLDGCDSRCKIEMIFRVGGMRPHQDPAPDFCVHANSAKNGNAFGQMMGDTSAMEDLIPEDMRQGDMMGGSMMTFIFHILGAEDPTFMAPDPLIQMGSALADPDPTGVGQDGLDWENSTDKLDFPVLIFPEFYDDDGLPISIAYARSTVEDGKTIVESVRPLTMGFEMTGGTFDYQGTPMELPVGKFAMRDIMMKIEIDPARSQMSPPPETAGIELPESAGNYGAASSEEATGIMCGAMDTELFESFGIPVASLGIISLDFTVICADQWGLITACQPGQEPSRGECSSMLDFLKVGCSSPLGVLMEPLGEPDADTDGDGEPDSYTMVMHVSAQRMKISGHSEEEPMGLPIPQEE